MRQAGSGRVDSPAGWAGWAAAPRASRGGSGGSEKFSCSNHQFISSIHELFLVQTKILAFPPM